MWLGRVFLLFVFVLVGVGCGSGSNFSGLKLIPIGSSPGGGGGPIPPPDSPPSSLQICSKLSIPQNYAPSRFSSLDQSAFLLALNITGNFEGPDGWANLSNNFDGQGVSMGLLQQNLGTGSLQPMLIKLSQTNAAGMAQIFSSAHFSSLMGMLNASQSNLQTSKSLSLMNLGLSLVANPLDESQSQVEPSAATFSASVQWAVNNLFLASGNFVPQWKTELTNLATFPDYVLLQLAAATNYHDLASKYLAQLELHEVRSYLMLFDIVVQNGGLYSTDLPPYQTWLAQNTAATETDKLTKILQLRLAHVKPVSVADVQARKTAIINGRGFVHSTNMNLENSYCYAGNTIYR